MDSFNASILFETPPTSFARLLLNSSGTLHQFCQELSSKIVFAAGFFTLMESRYFLSSFLNVFLSDFFTVFLWVISGWQVGQNVLAR